MPKQDAQADYSDVFRSYEFAFSNNFLKNNPFAKWIDALGLKGFDMDKLLRDNQHRLDALTRANQEAAAAYRTQIERQGEIIDAVLKAAAESALMLDMSATSEAASKNRETYSKAIETATTLMQRLSEETVAANQAAYQKIAKEVEAAIRTFQAV